MTPIPSPDQPYESADQTSKPGVSTSVSTSVNSAASTVPISLKSPHASGEGGFPEQSLFKTPPPQSVNPAVVILVAIAVMVLGWVLNSSWLGVAGAIVTLLASLRLLLPDVRSWLTELLSSRDRLTLLAFLGITIAVVGLIRFSNIPYQVALRARTLNWEAVGAIGEVIGAVGQILIAILAVYIAWRQYVISKDLTIQQNMITQQQTIDAYFQGISELVLDEEGLLEDWPQERAIAEGRTAAILSSVDANGKAKIIRFLSRAKLLTPLRRDRRLGRAILDGVGGYEEDRLHGVRVIDLGVTLARADLQGTDLRWTDLSEANLIRANLSYCDLVKSNLSRTILYEAILTGADLNSALLFYGNPEQASPRTRDDLPNYKTGEFTGAVVEGAIFTNAKEMSDAQRYYCCAWGGSKTRATIPGGCQGIPNKLGR
ncbi:MAG: pentapeptide repeat-containing protein [Cyanobacteria bacterium]|nr:pentapeptide repeat-containing protein [Cyanobacteriota bacterium]MDW8202859.1 pentapeptide repeat-containing protein [Cyanobacteriota bacterium SKYGB_h_bin112]